MCLQNKTFFVVPIEEKTCNKNFKLYHYFDGEGIGLLVQHEQQKRVGSKYEKK